MTWVGTAMTTSDRALLALLASEDSYWGGRAIGMPRFRNDSMGRGFESRLGGVAIDTGLVPAAGNNGGAQSMPSLTKVTVVAVDEAASSTPGCIGPRQGGRTHRRRRRRWRTC